MDLDFFFGPSINAPTKPPPQPSGPGGYDFAQQQQPQQHSPFFPQQQQPAYFPQQQQQQQQQQPYFPQQQQQQPYFPQQQQQQPYFPQQQQQPYSQPPFGGQAVFGAPQPGFGQPHASPGGFAPQQNGLYAPAASSAAPRPQPSSLLPQPSAKPATTANNDFFDIFGGDLLGGGGGNSQTQPKPQQSQPTSAQPQTIQYSNEDFLDMLGGGSSSAAAKPSSSPPSKPAPSPVQQDAPSTQASTFKRGQSKKDAAAKKDLNLDAFSQLAVSRSKAPTSSSTASSSSSATASSKKKAIAESESESESESEDDDDSNVKGPKNIDDDEQNMGTGQGFSPMDRGGTVGSGGHSSGARKCVAADCNNTFHGAGKYCAAHQRYESHPPESKDADGRKVKGEWSIERKRTGTKMGFIKNITIWKFYFKGEQHSIELRHSTFSGKRVILVDRRQLLSEKRLIGGDAAHKVFAGSDFETRCEVTVVIKSNNDRFQYGIFIEGLPIRDAKLKYAEYV